MRRVAFVLVAFATLAAAPAAAAAVAPVRWCGSDSVQTDRVRDRVGGPQVHVVYAIPADGDDRFFSVASDIATDVAAIDAWWRREDPERAPRFDLFEFAGCDSRFGMLDITHARLSQPSAAYLGTLRFGRISTELSRPPFNFNELDKKYLVFYDGPVHADGVCGIASGRPDRGGDFAHVYLRGSCGLAVGGGRGVAFVAAHELLHTLGAIERTSRNECGDNLGHVCDSAQDILWPFFTGSELFSALLDVNRDDYYGHGGPGFDVRMSRWLMQAPQVLLTIRVAGSGIVGSEPDGQGCTAICTTEWDAGTPVQLAAEPAPGFRFTAWTGACASSREPSCLVEAGSAGTVTATFRRLQRLQVAVTGRGTVTAPGLRCAARACVQARVDGETVALRARAPSGWRFVRWTGRCTHRRVTCVVRIGTTNRVGAVFARR